MPVGEMLRRMDSAEITEWIAYFKIQQPEQPKPADALRAMFGHKVSKKNNDQ
jgi:hypothetical protein